MHCLKCGRETDENQVFCQECLLDMEKHPVDSNEVVLLPQRPAAPAAKKPARRRTVTPEERIIYLKRRVRLLTVLLLVVILISSALAYPTVQYFRRYRLRLQRSGNAVGRSGIKAVAAEKRPGRAFRHNAAVE